MQFSRIWTAAVMMGAVAALGCAESVGPGMGRLEVRLTDAPFPFSAVSEVNVHVVRVEGRQQPASDAEIENASNSSGWVVIAEPNSTYNLLSLQGGVTANLGAATLSTGFYNAFRLILDTQQSNVVLTDNTVLDGSNGGIIFPSADQTGIKIFLDAPIQVVQENSVMILDFDVGKSFVLRGNSIRNNGLLFKPVIRATASELTGSISGTVLAETAEGEPVAGASVELLVDGTLLGDTEEANVVATTSTDAEGNFMFGWILPGNYEIRVTPPDGSPLAPALLEGGVTVVSGTETPDQVIILEEL
jgi:predicted acyltransferase (DUF342 family)